MVRQRERRAPICTRTPCSTILSIVALVLCLLGGLSNGEADTTASSSLFAGDENVIEITSEQEFTDKIAKDESVWMLYFYDSGKKNEQAVTTFSTLGILTKDLFGCAAIDMTADEGGAAIAGLYRISKPGFVLVGGPNLPRKLLDRSLSEATELKDLAQSIITSLTSVFHKRAEKLGIARPDPAKSAVVKATGKDFDEAVLRNPAVVFVAFTAPWCGHCKNLEPEWEAAATALAKQAGQAAATLVWVDATSERDLSVQYSVNGYPTIKYWPGGANKSSLDARDYTGPRTAQAIVQAVLEEIQISGVPPEIHELTSQQMLEDKCSGKNHLCVLAALPDILDTGANGRNEYRAVLAKVAKQQQQHGAASAFSFFWFQGGSQPLFESALELTFGFPAVVALSLDKQAYMVLRGSFSEKRISSFVQGLMSGKQGIAKLPQSLPALETVTPWDGLDGAPLEEEIPLSEIMGDDEL